MKALIAHAAALSASRATAVAPDRTAAAARQ
jgi:hypothetical protein